MERYGATLRFERDGVELLEGDGVEVARTLDRDAWVLVTDPPYGIRYRPPREHRFAGRGIVGDQSTATRDALLDVWGDRPAIVFGSWKRPKPEGVRALLIWDKGEGCGMGNLSIPWKPNHEEIYVLGHGAGDHFFEGRRTSGVLRFKSCATRDREYRHPNQKPVELLRELISKCPPGLGIFDPCAGSGSTLEAARLEGRRALGVEIDPGWIRSALRRLSRPRQASLAERTSSYTE